MKAVDFIDVLRAVSDRYYAATGRRAAAVIGFVVDGDHVVVNAIQGRGVDRAVILGMLRQALDNESYKLVEERAAATGTRRKPKLRVIPGGQKPR